MTFVPLIQDPDRPRRLKDIYRAPQTVECLTYSLPPLPKEWPPKCGLSPVNLGGHKFQFHLDVQHFSPDEISVRVVEGFVVVEASHPEKRDAHGTVSRKFSRRYKVPEGCNVDKMSSKLSADGVLTVSAPLEAPQGAGRSIPIMRTGPMKNQGECLHTGFGESPSFSPDIGE